MAEGLLGGLLGGEEEAAEAEAGEGRISAEAFAAALAADHAKYDPHVARAAEVFLEKQARLLDAQTEEIEEQRALRLRHLQSQSREGKLRRFGQRIRNGVQVVFAAVGGAMVVGLGVVVWQAAHAHGLVVEAFSSPPDLARNGLTGQVIAEELEDRINVLQAKTDSARAAATFANDWGRDVKVEIPETGVSLDEVQQVLREWLGHETRIAGSAVRTPDGVVRISARLEGEPADEASGPESDIEGVVSQVAEKVFARTQPYRYGVFLFENGRTEEARAAFEHLAADGPPEERGWALSGLAGLVSLPAAQEKAQQRAADAAPKLAVPRCSLSETAVEIGHDEAALEQGKACLRLLAQPGHGGISDRAWDAMSAAFQHEIDKLTQDQGDAWVQDERQAGAPAIYGSDLEARTDLPCILSAQHDLDRARAQAAQLGPDDAALLAQSLRFGWLVSTHACVAAAEGDWREAVRQMSAVDGALTPEQRTELAVATRLGPQLALALARSGDVTKAEAVVGQTPLDCYPCLIARGQVASAKRDARSAERWFAEAARQGPSLPTAYEAWGEARLARGDLKGAGWAFQEAVRRGDHWADPVKGLGDVDAGRGAWREAVDDYDRALKLAPAWAELKRARALAAKRLQ